MFYIKHLCYHQAHQKKGIKKTTQVILILVSYILILLSSRHNLIFYIEIAGYKESEVSIVKKKKKLKIVKSYLSAHTEKL
jgi:hypothetical protein